MGPGARGLPARIAQEAGAVGAADGVLLVGWVSQATVAANLSAPTPPQASAPRPQEAEALQDSGSFHRAKVRILGIPVLTVASPVVAGSRGPDARQRARVIEGNLELLYRAQEVCTQAEGLGEWILELLYLRSGQRACDSNQLGLLGDPAALRVEVAGGSGGLPVLQARVPGRELPLPLLSVTPDDARLNGTTPSAWRIAGGCGWSSGCASPATCWSRGCWGAASAPWRCWSWRWGPAGGGPGSLAAGQAPARPAGAAGGPGPGRSQRGKGGELRRGEPPPAAVSAAQPSRPPADPQALSRRLLIPALHLLSRTLLAGVVLLLPLMVGVAVLAVPGQIPLAIELLLQPFGVVGSS